MPANAICASPHSKLPLGVLVILVLAVVSLPAASASSSPTKSSAGDDKKVEVIRVTEVTVQDNFVDVGEQGDSLGDYFVFSGDLFRKGEKVGSDGGTGTIVRLESMVSATVQFVATAVLPKGQITVQGLTTFTDGPSTFELAITGGTGKYRTAHGVLIVDQVSDTESLLTFRIIR
jgi:hypothetical protein